MLPCNQFLGQNWRKWLTHSHVALAYQNREEYFHSDFKVFVGDDLAALCKNLVNFGSLTSEYKRGSGVTP